MKIYVPLFVFTNHWQSMKLTCFYNLGSLQYTTLFSCVLFQYLLGLMIGRLLGLFRTRAPSPSRRSSAVGEGLNTGLNVSTGAVSSGFPRTCLRSASIPPCCPPWPCSNAGGSSGSVSLRIGLNPLSRTTVFGRNPLFCASGSLTLGSSTGRLTNSSAGRLTWSSTGRLTGGARSGSSIVNGRSFFWGLGLKTINTINQMSKIKTLQAKEIARLT